MSAKMLPSLADENRDLQKQIGCMNGIFQLFDRHNFVTGQRITGGHNHKKLLQGATHSGVPKRATEKANGKNLKEVVRDKPRVSIESPQTSFSSSSCPSTVSLSDLSKPVQSEPPALNQSNFLETPTQISMKERSSSLQFSQQPPDLRDVIKESMHRECRGLSVKTVVKEEGRGRTLKHIDSPRPVHESKSGQPRVPSFHGSIRALPKLQEPPRNSKEEKDCPLRLARRDPPRFSYDGKETRDAFKYATKFKELPRLSLDSRESSLRNSVSESRLDFLPGNLKNNGKISQVLNTNQEPGSNKRPSNLVAKLMGLEAFPDSDSRDEGEIMKLHSEHNEDFETRPLNKAFNENKQNPAFSSRIEQKNPASPRLKNASSVTKPIPNSRFPLEPAPWKQPDASEDHPRKAQKNRTVCKSATQTSSSVYGEIEKRISDLEFRKSGKDLRALKQILEAMQNSRKRLENQKGEQADLESPTSRCSSDYSYGNQVSKALNWQSNQNNLLAQTKAANSPRRFESSLVLAKQARSMENSRISRSLVVPTTDTSHLQKLRAQNLAYSREDSIDKREAKDLTPRNHTLRNSSRYISTAEKKNVGKTSKTVQTSRAAPLVKAENCAAFGRTTGAVSPRLQEKKYETDKQSHITSQSREFLKARRKSSRQPIELDSSSRKLKPQSTNLQRGTDKSRNTETRNFCHHGDTGSVQSENNSSLASQTEVEVTSLESSMDIKQHVDSKNLEPRLREDVPFAELTLIATEQPSPVSVLDARFYREESPSPVKKISTVFQDYETSDPDEAEWHLDEADLSDRIATNQGNEFNLSKPENAKYLVHILRLVDTTPEEASLDKIVSVCTSTGRDHKYITKMLLASGLLKDTGLISTAIQLHSPCHLINPNLFHVLEQTEQYTDLANQEHSGKVAPSKCQKIHRKLLFDTVNEILVHKLASEGPFMPQKRTRTCQVVLRELYSEIDLLQANPECCLDDTDDLLSIIKVDMMQQPDDWADFQGEIPAVVLDIERLIFKDLITEVLTAEGFGHQYWPRRQCRNLFII